MPKIMTHLLSEQTASVLLACDFRREPSAPPALVNPDLRQAGGGDIVVPSADLGCERRNRVSCRLAKQIPSACSSEQPTPGGCPASAGDRRYERSNRAF